LNLAKAGCQRRAGEGIEAGVEHLTLRPEALITALFARPERPDQDVAGHFRQVGLAGEHALEDGTDAADLLDRFVCDVNNSLRHWPFQLKQRCAPASLST